jgi:regulator of protease activity HflC (stomatin/prohibitin superfamily)
MSPQRVPNLNPKPKWLLPTLVGGAAVLLLLLSVTKVPTGQTGVVLTFGAPTGRVMKNGIHLKLPFIQTVTKVNNQIQKLESAASAVSKDLQAISSVIAVNYKLSAASSVEIVRNFGSRQIEDTILAPGVQESVKAVTAKYTAEGLITERAKVGTEISLALENKVAEHGIIIEGFNIVNFEFSDDFNKAIEAKQVAQQELIRVRTEQEQLVVKAQAAAEAAKANAEAILTEATAQAQANGMINASLTANLVEYEKVNKWDGKLPQVSGSSAIVDFRSPAAD